MTDLHTCADAGVTVTGESLIELFADAATGLTEIMVDLDGLEEKREISFRLESGNPEDLFFNWLSEIIYHKDASCFLVRRCDLKISEGDRIELEATLYGDEIDPDRHNLKIDVKAVTYYKFRVEKVNNHWQGEVVFDI